MALEQTVRDQANDIRDNADAQYASIRSDGRRSPAGIQSAVATVYLGAKAQMDDLQNLSTTTMAALGRNLINTAFGLNVSGSPAEIAAASMSYRDAQDRVQDITNPQVAQQLMDRANDSADELLAKALAQLAFGLQWSGYGWTDVLDSYTATRPAAAAAIVELQEFNNSQNNRMLDGGLADLWAFVLPKPPELQGLNDEYQIQVLAANA